MEFRVSIKTIEDSNTAHNYPRLSFFKKFWFYYLTEYIDYFFLELAPSVDISSCFCITNVLKCGFIFFKCWAIDTENCAICIENYKAKDTVRLLPCK